MHIPGTAHQRQARAPNLQFLVQQAGRQVRPLIIQVQAASAAQTAGTRPQRWLLLRLLCYVLAQALAAWHACRAVGCAPCSAAGGALQRLGGCVVQGSRALQNLGGREVRVWRTKGVAEASHDQGTVPGHTKALGVTPLLLLLLLMMMIIIIIIIIMMLGICLAGLEGH